MKEQLLKIRDKLGEKKQVSDMVYCTFKEAIATGILAPGFRLKEEELADWFQISRTPVREAIKKLEMEGLTTTDSTHGCIIHELQLDECLDTLEMLEWLRTAAIYFLKGRIPRTILMRLEANLHHGKTLKDPIQQYDNNVEFHSLLIKATGNTELIQITKRLEFKERIIVNNILTYNYSPNYVQHHRELLQAIIDNDTNFIKEFAIQNQEKANKYMNDLISHYLSN